MTAANTPNNSSVYDRLGGAPAVQALVQRFYALMDEWPETGDVRRLHPDSLSSSQDSLFKFLSGWFGGPPLYVRERGHPRLRMRHQAYRIGTVERDQWLLCMHQALDEQVADAGLRSAMRQAFDGMADHLANTGDVAACG